MVGHVKTFAIVVFRTHLIDFADKTFITCVRLIRIASLLATIGRMNAALLLCVIEDVPIGEVYKYF